jgi:sulfoxide reductase heme-binding subunit YedZ
MTLWYLARAAGFVALLAATTSVALGALASSRRADDVRGRDRRILRQLAHRSAAVVTLAMLALHVVLLVTDRYVDLTVPGVLVPFTAGYRGFALGLGTLAAYSLLVVAVSGAARGRLAASARAARAWRVVHMSAYVAWLLSMAHGILAGTDTGRWWAWSLYGGCAAVVFVAVVVRAGSADDQHDSALSAARRRLIPGGVR